MLVLPGDFQEDNLEPEQEQPARDPKIDLAKAALMTSLFGKNPDEVFYGRQVEVLYEEQFFHWITARALNELAREGKVNSQRLSLAGKTDVRFYWPRRNRYWKRKAAEIKKLIQEHASDEFTRAVGYHGEMMFDAALPTQGFIPTARNLRAFGDRQWTETGHELDRVFERDGVAYGAEVKNTLAYIPRQELETKLRMCDHLGLRPLFILRFAPKTYIEMVRRAGGFTLVFKYQLLPHGSYRLAKRLRDRLRLPVDCPHVIEEGTVKRFLNWHLRQLSR